ncbi:MAG TPA: hypothetical protein VGM13_17510 [Thermoanaerobaculia bacterium]
MSTAYRLFAALGGVALLAASGWALVSFVPSLRRKPPLLRIAWSYLLGCAFAGVSLYALSHWGGVELRRGTILPVLLMPLALAAWMRRKAPRSASSPRPASSHTARAAVALAALSGAFVSAAVFADALSGVQCGFDARMTWNAHAGFVRAARTVDAPVLLDGGTYLHNPKYPLLLPILQVAVQETFDTDDDERVTRPLYAVFLPVLLLVVFDVAAPRAGTLAAALIVLAMALLPALAFEWDGGAITSYADIPLGLFWGAGLALSLSAPWRPPEALTAGLLLGAGALAKTEGLLLGAIVVALAALRALRRARRTKRLGPVRATALAAAVFAAAAALCLSWRAQVPNRNSETWDEVTAGQIVSGVAQRLPAVLHFVRIEMARPEVWSRFWWLAPALFLLGARALNRPFARGLLVASAAALAVYLAAYGGSSWTPEHLVHPTWNRFLSQLAVPLYVLLACAVADAFGRSQRAPRGGRPKSFVFPAAASCRMSGAGSSSTNHTAPSSAPVARRFRPNMTVQSSSTA